MRQTEYRLGISQTTEDGLSTTELPEGSESHSPKEVPMSKYPVISLDYDNGQGWRCVEVYWTSAAECTRAEGTRKWFKLNQLPLNRVTTGSGVECHDAVDL